MRRRMLGILITGALVAVLFGSALSAGADASPAWSFEGTELFESESVAGGAVKSTLSFPGLSTTCDLSYGMTIENFGGKAKGSLKSMTFSNCSTNSKSCTVESAIAERLPWPLHGATVGVSNYVIFEGIKFTILYGGEECALFEFPVAFTGTAGGIYDNSTGTFTFTSTSFSATKTAIKALSAPATWTAVFSTEALGAHSGQILKLG